jgi:hypothetical protein
MLGGFIHGYPLRFRIEIPIMIFISYRTENEPFGILMDDVNMSFYGLIGFQQFYDRL